jgi:hypothetical protein
MLRHAPLPDRAPISLLDMTRSASVHILTGTPLEDIDRLMRVARVEGTFLALARLGQVRWTPKRSASIDEILQKGTYDELVIRGPFPFAYKAYVVVDPDDDSGKETFYVIRRLPKRLATTPGCELAGPFDAWPAAPAPGSAGTPAAAVIDLNDVIRARRSDRPRISKRPGLEFPPAFPTPAAALALQGFRPHRGAQLAA